MLLVLPALLSNTFTFMLGALCARLFGRGGAHTQIIFDTEKKDMLGGSSFALQCTLT